ncbi:hypothetical protein L249_6245 [Ophiocordyceps polyrhachis-furcata BCC 54312]|uniref:DNA-directed RNA polymerase RBP11-like dimerisation domain-containing protein n=1 Tax=Ophiocordyceps polyrhachis-furcata BCC 54312 TaxID=1330021 RepID=A0A367L166_9HYPO|nr:hypothetical protein L249_6245 [Ophiocordyceps polyrhachis-furcata BCC 54312]
MNAPDRPSFPLSETVEIRGLARQDDFKCRPEGAGDGAANSQRAIAPDCRCQQLVNNLWEKKKHNHATLFLPLHDAFPRLHLIKTASLSPHHHPASQTSPSLSIKIPKISVMAGCNIKHFNIQDNVFELFLLAEGEKKIEEKVYSGKPPFFDSAVAPLLTPPQGMSNTSDFILNKEDHTLGNLLSEHLKLHPNVYMAGYKRTEHVLSLRTRLAHPNVPQLFIRVQTDGSKTPREVFCAVCEKLINQLESLHQAFTREWELRRITNIGEQAMQANGH